VFVNQSADVGCKSMLLTISARSGLA